MIKLQHHIKSTLGWCISLGSKFIRVVPVTTIAVQIMTLASQLLLLLAFFLPLKVIILLGSEKIPSYFPVTLQEIKREHLIFSLSIAAALCYALYIASEIAISYCCKFGARTLLLRSAKLNLFENQEKIAAHAYSRYTRASAAALFFALSTAVLLFIYPSLAAIILGYILLATATCIISFNISSTARTQLKNNYTAVLNTLSGIGFLLSFFCLVADFLYNPQQKIFHAVVAILVMRQALQRLTSMILDIISLRIQHHQINAMFFHSQPLLEAKKDSNELEQLLNPGNRERWAAELMEKAGLTAGNNLEVHWHQIDAMDVYPFRITVDVDGEKRQYLAKLFGEHISSLAQQERLLLSSQSGLPAPEWIGHYSLGQVNCHLFKLEDHSKVNRNQITGSVVAINTQLMCCEPEPDLLLKFSRTRLYLESRLSEELIAPLKYVCSTESDHGKVEEVIQSLGLIAERIAALPRQIVGLDITTEALLLAPYKGFQLSHWCNWRIEAIGSNWPVAELQHLPGALSLAVEKRPALAGISSDDVMLTALMYSFERFLQRKNYPAALELLGDILACLSAVDARA
ncbi:hypothetical protein ACIQUF_16415 [Pseudomonas sp. NPDC090233]|uniref:hypothetical protein n=1 Tax=Pseudomonas sp. NPDC090233 TaxID=3364479 RepID=UPI00383BADEC